jgi:hypothetical protein
MSGMAFCECEGYIVVCHCSANPTRDEWEEYLRYVRERVPAVLGTLVMTAGGTPNSGQRKALAGVVGERRPPVAIITDSPIARGAITAFGWLGLTRMKPFAPTSIQDALDYLGVEPAKRHLVLAQLTRLNHYFAQEAAKTG